MTKLGVMELIVAGIDFISNTVSGSSITTEVKE
jgi:hypothetical protein